MRLTLSLHPDSRCEAVTGIELGVARTGHAGLQLTYSVTGAIGDIVIPPPAAPARVDELWRRTCFEVFIRPASGETYFEFNFAPSGAWAAYRFDAYRAGMTEPATAPPHIAGQAGAARYELQVALDLAALEGLPPDAPWRLGISAVIEERTGGRSYWALAHPPGKPDFHHAHAFAHDLAPGTRR
jgi:hypothetical protein